MLIAGVLLLSEIFISIQAVSLMPSNRRLQFDRFDGMGRGRDVPMRASFKIIRQENSVYYMNSTTYITEDINGSPKMYVTVIRCNSKENLDSCEEIFKSSPSSYCKSLDPVQGKMNPFHMDYKPELTCPLKKGTYYAVNHKLDITPLVIFPLGTSYWRGVIEIKDEKTSRLLLILYTEGRLVKA